jgi:hypothetical protein
VSLGACGHPPQSVPVRHHCPADSRGGNGDRPSPSEATLAAFTAVLLRADHPWPPVPRALAPVAIARSRRPFHPRRDLPSITTFLPGVVPPFSRGDTPCPRPRCTSAGAAGSGSPRTATMPGTSTTAASPCAARPAMAPAAPTGAGRTSALQDVASAEPAPAEEVAPLFPWAPSAPDYPLPSLKHIAPTTAVAALQDLAFTQHLALTALLRHMRGDPLQDFIGAQLERVYQCGRQRWGVPRNARGPP